MIDDNGISKENQDFLKNMTERNRKINQDDFMNDFFKQNPVDDLNSGYQRIRKRNLLIKGFSLFGGLIVLAVVITILVMRCCQPPPPPPQKIQPNITKQVICVFFNPIKCDEKKLFEILGVKTNEPFQVVLFSDDKKPFIDTIQKQGVLNVIEKYSSTVQNASWNRLQQLLNNVKLEIDSKMNEKRVIFFGDMPLTSSEIASSEAEHVILDDLYWHYLRSLKPLELFYSLSRYEKKSNTTIGFISKSKSKGLDIQEIYYD